MVKYENDPRATLVHVPHASLCVPGEYRGDFTPGVLPRELRLMTDRDCHRLFDQGRTLLLCPVSRLVCDVERFRNDRQEPMAAA